MLGAITGGLLLKSGVGLGVGGSGVLLDLGLSLLELGGLDIVSSLLLRSLLFLNLGLDGISLGLLGLLELVLLSLQLSLGLVLRNLLFLLSFHLSDLLLSLALGHFTGSSFGSSSTISTAATSTSTSSGSTTATSSTSSSCTGVADAELGLEFVCEDGHLAVSDVGRELHLERRCFLVGNECSLSSCAHGGILSQILNRALLFDGLADLLRLSGGYLLLVVGDDLKRVVLLNVELSVLLHIGVAVGV